MADVLTAQTLALAGAIQSLTSVNTVAQYGQVPRSEFEPCIHALLNVYDGDVAALYGGEAHLDRGLRRLHEQLTQPTDTMLTRYLVAVIYLERRLRKNRQMLSVLGQRLDDARRQAEYFSPTHANVITNLAGLYGDTISNLKPRIMVQGNRDYLEQPGNADLIRALLLSAIRAVSLWREAGGTRWRLLFTRGRVVECASQLLAKTRP